MIFVDNQKNNDVRIMDARITDARINLSIEEFLQRHLETTEDVLLFYINGPSIIIGRHQNTIEEINQTYVKENGVHVVRRQSGGGAVYHDLGNLNFSFITTYREGDFRNFAKFTRPVIAALQAMNIPAELSGRNDILVEGRKISGNAQYHSGSRLVTHGTLLFNTNIEDLVSALNVKETKISSKGIKSVRSRVANISEYLTEPMDILEFRQRLLVSLFNNGTETPQYVLQDDDWNKINEIAASRYLTWEWNFGRSPDYNVQKEHRFDFGEIDARVKISRGKIDSIRLFGDYQSTRDVALLEASLTGVRYDAVSLQTALQTIDLSRYFAGLSTPEFVSFLTA